MTAFELNINKHLKQHAIENPNFTYDESKITDCCNYIISEVQKMSRTKSIALTDDEVYKLARDFYNDGKEAPKEVKNCKVVHSVPELTEEEKELARAEALRQYQEDEKAKLEEQAKKIAEAKAKAEAKKKEQEEKKLAKKLEDEKKAKGDQLSLDDFFGGDC